MKKSWASRIISPAKSLGEWENVALRRKCFTLKTKKQSTVGLLWQLIKLDKNLLKNIYFWTNQFVITNDHESEDISRSGGEWLSKLLLFFGELVWPVNLRYTPL